MLSARNLVVLALLFSYDLFWVNFCTWYETDTTSFFAWWYPLVPVQFVENTFLSPLNCLGILGENKLTIKVFISGLSVLFHRSICLYLYLFSLGAWEIITSSFEFFFFLISFYIVQVAVTSVFLWSELAI